MKKIGVSCLAGLTVFSMASIGVNAEIGSATSNAGISAALEQSYYTEKVALDTTVAEQAPVEQTPVTTGIAGYTNLGIANIDSYLNVRDSASEDGGVVGKMAPNDGCEILAVEGDWSRISSGSVEGYVKNEFLMTGEEAVNYAPQVMSTKAIVNTETLKVRATAGTDAEVLTLVPQGEELQVLEDAGEWLKVDINGEEGYIAKEFVDLSSELSTAVTIEELKYGEGVSDVRVDLVQYALQFVGNPYVWGGTSLTNGADCSGFVLSVYANYGIGLPHSSASQAGCGTRIDASEAQPGDLFFYGDGSSISHVAIYIGNGQVVQAYSDSDGIKVTSAYYRTPVCVTSLL